MYYSFAIKKLVTETEIRNIEVVLCDVSELKHQGTWKLIAPFGSPSSWGSENDEFEICFQNNSSTPKKLGERGKLLPGGWRKFEFFSNCNFFQQTHKPFIGVLVISEKIDRFSIKIPEVTNWYSHVAKRTISDNKRAHASKTQIYVEGIPFFCT